VSGGEGNEGHRDPGRPMTAGASAGRPLERLPLRQLAQLSMYWFGINAIWGGLNIVLQERVPPLAPAGESGRYLAYIDLFAVIVAVGVQPTIGSLSDYTISRWGRRKPYIAIGAVLDVVFLIGIATTQTYLMLFAFVVLLQFSSNFAQGPFQGFIPDLVPAGQVGSASAIVGVMSILGVIGGTLIVSAGYPLGSFMLPTIVIGLVELATAVGTLAWVDDRRPPKDRGGRSWFAIAREAWGLDLLRERSFLWLVASRLFVLAGVAVLTKLVVLYMARSLGLDEAARGFWVPATSIVVALITVTSTLPAARISDRVGRKPVIYAACLFGAFGAAIVAAAPTVLVAEIGVLFVAFGSGAFLSVDWALMTDLIPKASSGRYMGISNVATACAGPVALLSGGTLMDLVGGPEESGSGPRAAFGLAVLLFLLGAIFLTRVVEGHRDDPARTGFEAIGESERVLVET
jgi:MFS family permease